MNITSPSVQCLFFALWFDDALREENILQAVN